jgi:uncharacterized protein YuzE
MLLLPFEVVGLPMKLNYYPDTDSLYIRLSERMSIDSRQVITGGVILDYDESGNLVGIDVENASSKLDLSEVQTSNFPIRSSSAAERHPQDVVPG